MLGIGQSLMSTNVSQGFTIDTLSGLVAWYPFNTGQTEVSGALAAWADASGNSRTLINTLQTNKRPTYQSGRINFGDVTNSFMDINNGPVPNSVAYTLFFVIEFAVGSSTSLNTLVSSASGSNNTASFTWGPLSGGSSQLFQVLTAGASSSDSFFNAVVSSNLVSNNVKTILQYTYGGGTTAGDTDFIISKDEDGGALTQIASRTLANASNHTQGFNAVGLDSASFFPKGFIDEIVIFNRKLSVSEAADVRADIKARNSMT